MQIAVPSGWCSAERLGVARRALQVFTPELPCPGGIDVEPAPLQGHRKCSQSGSGAREQLDLTAPILAQLFPAVCDADEAGVRKNGGRAVAELVVELAADDDHQIRFLHRLAAHRAYYRVMARWHQPAALLRVEVEGAGHIEEAHELPACSNGTASADNQRTPGSGDERRGTLNVGGIGRDTAWRLWPEVLVEDQCRVNRFPQHVHGDLDVNGSRG